MTPPSMTAFDVAMTDYLAKMPRLLHNYYEALKEAGFSDARAWTLTRDWQVAILGKAQERKP